MKKKPTILAVDDEKGVRQSFSMVLKGQFDLFLAKNGLEARSIFNTQSIDLVLLDILLPDEDGLDLLAQFKKIDPDVEIVMVTAVKDIRTAVRAIKMGAREYLIKPFDVEEMLAVIDRTLEKRRMQRELAYLREELKRVHPFEEMVGKDERMLEIFDLINTVASGSGAVLVQGESGTGKELVARAIHNRSTRIDMPFVVVNCAAIPEALVESELFGHTRGAFTGATKARAGKLEIADSGTVFLDDIESLDINTQAKLLRVIQEKEFGRVGSNRTIRVDVRFIAASNKNIKSLLETGALREDLYYRLNVFPIVLPPLRERHKDVPLLLDHFMTLHAKTTGQEPKTFTTRAKQVLSRYPWPGNVRELENLVERLFTVVRGEAIRVRDLPPFQVENAFPEGMKLKDAVKVFEKQYIGDILERVNGNRGKAASLLGIHRNTLLAKINDLDV